MSALTDIRLPLDEPIFRAVNGLGWPWLDAVFAAVSSRTFGLTMLAVIGVWLALHLKKRSVPAVLGLALTVAVTDELGNLVLKPWVGRMRPCFAMHDGVRLLVDVGNVGSMPSLHSANAFAVATLAALLVRRAGWITYPLATIIALSRVGVGVHWPSDVLVGALYGALVGLGFGLAARRWAVPKAAVATAPVAPPNA